MRMGPRRGRIRARRRWRRARAAAPVIAGHNAKIAVLTKGRKPRRGKPKWRRRILARIVGPKKRNPIGLAAAKDMAGALVSTPALVTTAVVAGGMVAGLIANKLIANVLYRIRQKPLSGMPAFAAVAVGGGALVGLLGGLFTGRRDIGLQLGAAAIGGGVTPLIMSEVMRRVKGLSDVGVSPDFTQALQQQVARQIGEFVTPAKAVEAQEVAGVGEFVTPVDVVAAQEVAGLGADVDTAADVFGDSLGVF